MEDRLYKFARLIDAGSFTKAAQAMHISQPALTTAIKKLERELQAELLIRDSHTFKLTAAGAIAYDTAKELSTHAHNLKLRLAETAGHKVSLHVGAIDSLTDLLFVHSNHLQELEQGTQLSLIVDNTSRLLKYVERDELDIALVAKPSSLSSTLMAIDLGVEPLILVTHSTHAEQVKRELKGNKLRQFLSYNQNSHTQRLVSLNFDRLGIEVSPTFYSTSPEIMLQLVLAGRGTAVLPYILVKPYLDQKKLSPLRIGDSCVVARNIASVHRAGRLLPDQATKLLASTRTELTQLLAQAKLL